MAEVVAVCISAQKGTVKDEVPSVILKENWGIEGDAHAGIWHRQVSLLAEESIAVVKKEFEKKGLSLKHGAFGENVVTSGIDLKSLALGARIRIGDCVLELTQIGKQCHSDCEIKVLTGKCVMPTDGTFYRVIKGGEIKKGDSITVLS